MSEVDANEAWLKFEVTAREYQALKAEQLSRIGFRDNLLYATLAATGSLLAFVFSEDPGQSTNPYRALCIFAGPWISIILGWAYATNDCAITRIGDYINTVLAPRLAEIVPQSVRGVFAWEDFHRSDESRIGRKVMQLAVDVCAFPLSGVFLIVIGILNNSYGLGGLLVTFICIELVFLAAVFWYMVRRSAFFSVNGMPLNNNSLSETKLQMHNNEPHVMDS